MSFLASIFFFALSRAELIDRLAAVPTVQADGLIKVIPDCPSDMRKEFQLPIAKFANETVEFLYQGLSERRKRFTSPGIVIYIGEERTNNTEVISRVKDSSVRIYLPAPGFSDIDKLRLEIVKGFALALREETLDDEGAMKLYRKADPILRLMDEQRSIEKWMRGEEALETEAALKSMRKVYSPGHISPLESKVFASRLMLYPKYFSAPFLGKYSSLTFAEAIELGAKDSSVRLAAYEKSYELPLYGGGRGEKLDAAMNAYRTFLLEFAAAKKSEIELRLLLNTADELLKEAANEKNDYR